MVVRDLKYVHTNLVARDWRALAGFYITVFGCVPVPPERDLSGSALEAGTGIPGARVRGVHLRLPGYDEEGPTLEIFQYSEPASTEMPVAEGPAEAPAVNRPGFGHIAFSVASVPEALREVLAHGGSTVGDVVTLEIADGRSVSWCYLRDPEGNIIELQTWL